MARRGVAHGSGLGKVRWVVERAFARLHHFKRLRSRYERRADLRQGVLEAPCPMDRVGVGADVITPADLA